MIALRRRDVLAAGLALPVSVVAGPIAGAAAKRPVGASLPPGTLLLGPQATLSRDELSFRVTVVGPADGGAFEFEDLVVGSAHVTTFHPSLVTAIGQKQQTVTASPCPPVKGTVDLTLLVNYDVGGQIRQIASPVTKVSIVAPQAFGRTRRP